MSSLSSVIVLLLWLRFLPLYKNSCHYCHYFYVYAMFAIINSTMLIVVFIYGGIGFTCSHAVIGIHILINLVNEIDSASLSTLLTKRLFIAPASAVGGDDEFILMNDPKVVSYTILFGSRSDYLQPNKNNILKFVNNLAMQLVHELL